MPIKNGRLQKNCQTVNPQIQIVVVGGGGDRTQANGGLAVGGEGAGVGLGAGVKAEGELVGASQQLRGDFNRIAKGGAVVGCPVVGIFPEEALGGY